MKIDKNQRDRYMVNMGFRDSLIGTTYLKRAIELWKPRVFITKELYPQIAHEYSTSAVAVERACRHAIGSAFARGDTCTANRIFGYSIKAETGIPTVSDFVGRMARVCSGED